MHVEWSCFHFMYKIKKYISLIFLDVLKLYEHHKKFVRKNEQNRCTPLK